MSIQPTPFSDLNEVLGELVHHVQTIVGANLVGIYLQGSFAVGDFDCHSDVDFIVVIREPLSEAVVAALQVMHGRIYDLDVTWAQHLEGSYFPQAVWQDLKRCGELLWYLDNGSRQLIQSDHCNTVVVRWTVREYGLALVGPAPSTLIASIPITTLRQEVWETMTRWGQEIVAEPDRYNNRFYQSFIVLSYCRMWQTFYQGTLESKRAGAAWAKTQLASVWHGLIDRTWAGRPNPAVSVRQLAEPQDFVRTLQFVQHVIEACEAYNALEQD